MWSSACGWLLVLGAAGSRVARLAGSRRRACVWWRTGHLVSGRPPRPLPSSRRKGCARLKPPPSFPHAGCPCSSAQPCWQAGIHPRQPSPAPHTFCHTSSLHLLVLLLAGLRCFLHSCSICSALRHLRLADLCALKSAPAMLRRRDTGAIAMRACERHAATAGASSGAVCARSRTRARSSARAAFETRGSRGRGLSELFSQLARSALARSPQLRLGPRARERAL